MERILNPNPPNRDICRDAFTLEVSLPSGHCCLSIMASPLFPTDTVKDIADSLGIVNLSSEAAKQLAMDVEFRIQEVVQEALMFMRHSKRTVLSPADISNALKSLNVEVLSLLESAYTM